METKKCMSLLFFLLVINNMFTTMEARTPIGEFNVIYRTDSVRLYACEDYVEDYAAYMKQKNRMALFDNFPLDISEVVALSRGKEWIKECLSEQTLSLFKLENKPVFLFVGMVDKTGYLKSCAVSLSSRKDKDLIVLTEEEARCLIGYCLTNFTFKNKRELREDFLRGVFLAIPYR